MPTEFNLCKDGKLRPYKLRTLEECYADFWKRVRIGGMDECWEWTGGKNSTSNPLQFYGTVWMRGRKWKTHRVAYALSRNGIPGNVLVCHHCDNPPCCNPFHLFVGTHKDNAMDCVKKKRNTREMGEDRYNATLTEKDVREIRASYVKRKNGGCDALASKYGVGRTMIHAIVKRRRWKHVD